MISWNLNSVLFQICNGHWMPIGKGFESKQPPKISAPNTEEPTLNPRNTAKELWINTPWGTFSPMVGQPGQKDVGRKGKLHRSGHQDHQAPGIKHKKCLKPLAKITRSEILQKQHMCETSATVYIYIKQINPVGTCAPTKNQYHWKSVCCCRPRKLQPIAPDHPGQVSGDLRDNG